MPTTMVAKSGITGTLVLAVILMLSGLTGACSTSSEQPETLLSILVTPLTPTISTGATLQFVAIGTYSDTTTKDLSAAGTVTWSSSTPATATISNTGLANAVAAGTTVISATIG